MLTVRDVTVARGGVPLLSSVSFSLASGQALALRGPNGVGKTSLLRTIAGLQAPVRGEVVCDPPAYAGHADALKHMLSVRENLAFWSAVYGGETPDKALAAFDLTALADRLAGTLSAGQKRRLGLARLLVTGRRLWLLDEPTVSLDVGSVDLFGSVLSAHLASGGAAVVATHVDLGIDLQSLDVSAFIAGEEADGAFDEAFL